MKKLNTLILITVLACTILAFTQKTDAQRYFTRSGHIWFYSHTPVEDIEAHNYKATSIMDINSGAIEFSVLMNSFQFEKALMQEHFNENYVESEKYPNAKFKGEITNLDAISFNKDGTYNAKVEGNLTIKDATNQVSTTSTFTVKNGKIAAKSQFKVKPADYNIEIPGVVRDKIAKEIEVNVEIDYEELNR